MRALYDAAPSDRLLAESGGGGRPTNDVAEHRQRLASRRLNSLYSSHRRASEGRRPIELCWYLIYDLLNETIRYLAKVEGH